MITVTEVIDYPIRNFFDLEPFLVDHLDETIGKISETLSHVWVIERKDRLSILYHGIEVWNSENNFMLGLLKGD